MQETAAMMKRHGEVFIVFLDRTDMEDRRKSVRANEEFIRSLNPRPNLELDRQMDPTERLRIWRAKEVR